MKNRDGFELDERGDIIMPEDFDFAVFLCEDFERLRSYKTTDELKEACFDLMTSKNINEEQLNSGLAVIRDRLREMYW